MRRDTPIVVVGGGVIGLLTAWYLAEAGESTVVIDRQTVGSEASWAGGGLLSPLYPTRYPAPLRTLCAVSLKEYFALFSAIPRLRADCECVQSGLLVLDQDLTISESGGDQIDSWVKVNPDIDLHRLEPELSLRQPDGFIFPNVYQLRNPRFLTALRNALTARKVQFKEGTEVLSVFPNGTGGVALRTKDETIVSDRCVLTAGAWTRELLRHEGLDLPIRPIRGQMLAIDAVPGLIKHVIVQNYRYLIPRQDGLVLVGSTFEDVGFDKATTLQAQRELRDVAVNLVPALGDYPVRHHWAGLRPGSPDDVPFVGRHPRIPGLFVCAGHHRNGFAAGPASARLVVDLLLGHNPDVDPSPYRLDRPCPEWSNRTGIK